MSRIFKIGNLTCLCASDNSTDKIAYVLYPMDILSEWIDDAAKIYHATIVVITGMDWQNVFSPWPAAGVPKGTPDFKGESPAFLGHLQQTVIPQIESALKIRPDAERTLFGVSMSGLFALWQWAICDTFANIASMSGSFWYEGFTEWFMKRSLQKKSGKAFFLLGNQEAKSPVKAFDTVADNTQAIVKRLRSDGVNVTFKSVPGNHYANPIPRLNASFNAIYGAEE